MKSKVQRKAGKKVAEKSVVNRRARFDYQLGDELIVGLALTGAETKAARFSEVSLRGSYVVPRNYGKNPELFLINAGFTLPNFSRKSFQDSSTKIDTRERKILAKRKEIDRFLDAKKSGMSIIPVKLLTHGRYIKLVIALGKGKKLYDKRETIKRKDQQRENAKIIKNLG